MTIKPIREKSGFEKVWDFIKRKGYYVVLIVCLAVVGLLGYQMADSARTLSEEAEEQAVSSEASDAVEASTEEIPLTVPEAEEDEPEAEPADTEETAEPEVVPETEYSGKVWPVEGAITKDFSEDDLVFSETLEEWRTHMGIDIASEMGAQVYAAQSGTVTNVETGTQWGIVITIDHGDGTLSKYMNLSTGDMVAVGDVVRKGQVISGIGDTALTELTESPHLHFEVYQDGIAVNPIVWLPQPFSEDE